MTLTPAEKAGCLFANQKLALAITPYFFNLIDRDDPDCPLRKQVIPRSDEMVISSGEMLDSLGEDEHSPVPGLVHRYPDRVLLKLVHVCPVYCRFCFRREMVGPRGRPTLSPKKLQAAFDYVRAHDNPRKVWYPG